MKPHHFKTDAEWLADVRRTAEGVKKQNEVLHYSKPVELTADEVLELVRRAEDGGPVSGCEYIIAAIDRSTP